MKNNYIKSERMWNVCLTYVYRMFYVISILFTIGVGQSWAGEPYIEEFGIQFYESSTNRYFKTSTEIKNSLAFGNKTSDFKIVYIYANAKKNGGNLCGAMYFKWWLEGTDGASNDGGVGYTSNSFSGDYCYEKFGTENGSSALDGIDLVQNRRPGNYTFKFFYSFEGNKDNNWACGQWFDCKYSNGDWKFTYTIPDPTITITGASSLVAGTSTNIQASISNYPVGSKITKVRVTGNIASAKETTGSATSLTVSSVTPNASGSNGITVTVTVKFGTGGTKDYTYQYNVTPPAVSDFTISATSGRLGGSGTSENPWLVTYNGSLTLGLSGATKAYADGNASPQYSTDGTNYGTTGSYISKTHSSITETTNQNWKYKARLKNNSSALYGSVKEKTVYWKVSTSSVTLHKNGGSSDGSATATHGRNSLSSISTPSKTGYNVEGYYTNEACTIKVATSAGALQPSTTYTTSGSLWNVLGAQTLYTKWTANTYTLKLNKNNGSADGSIKVTYDSNSTSNFTAVTRTGYNCTGYWTSTSGGNKIINQDGTLVAYSSSVSTYINSSGNWIYDGSPSLNAQWTPKTCTVNFNFDESDAGYGSKTGATTSTTATYAASMTSVTPPTAKEGYAFMGYWDAVDGAGTQYYKADGTSERTWNKDTESPTTLYAYYKKAEITGITFSTAGVPGSVIAPSTSTTATATISPTPTGTTTICWRVLHNNGNPLEEQPTFDPEEGAAVSFTTPATSGSYLIEARLRLGSGCSGTVLDSVTSVFQVAGDHNVTVQYKDASGNTIKASEIVTGRPLAWSSAIEAPEIFGYTFSQWEAVDGVTISTDGTNPIVGSTTSTRTIYIKAVYDGRLTAVYNQNKYLYLDLSQEFSESGYWNDPWVYFYNGGNPWDASNGVGAQDKGDYHSHYKEAHAMTQIGTSKIWYFDYSGVSASNRSQYIAFTWGRQDGQKNFNATDVIFRGDFNEGTPLFVPATGQTAKTVTNTSAKYYNSGYWVKYLGPQTGYTLEIYNADGSSLLKSISFSNEGKRMPMIATADLEAGKTYKYQLRRDNGIFYGNSGTMTNANRGPLAFTNDPSFPGMCGLITTAAGDYTFHLIYSKSGSSFDLRISVDYPAKAGDFQILYNDRANWSQSSAHSASWYHPSRVIESRANGKDTISFYVYKDDNTALTARKVNSITAGTGAITWEATNIGASASMNLGSVDSTGVYNFEVVQNADGTAITSITNLGVYTGNYYIRTDAVNSKWDNYTTDAAHLMTYSAFSESNENAFGEKYSHYKTQWCFRDKNIKFVIANDYSPCISDTLVQDVPDKYRNIDSYGNLKNDGSDNPDVDRYSTNVRFMWNRKTNKVSRAYVASASNKSRLFLVLRGNDVIKDESGTELNEQGVTHGAIMDDDQNWIYERIIQVKPGTKFKLFASYALKTPERMDSVQYFRGAYYSGDNKTTCTFNESNSVVLLGGDDASYQKVRIIYDFKTNRLVCAWLPSGNITSEKAINADVMFIREHQEDFAQLTFSGEGKISKITAAYAVLRFNKYTLNNKSKTGVHAVLDPPLSRYERDLFYVSFPFRVAMSEVFGFGTYGKHWIIEYYDGEARAANGLWKDTPSYWRFITNRNNKFFEPNQGYIIALDLDELGEESDIWDNEVENVELFFPSYGTMPEISSSSVTYNVPAHECTINRPTPKGDRRISDSHWNILSVPTYVNTQNATFESNTWTTAKTNYLYEWNSSDNTLTPRTTSGYTFRAMNAYTVQFYGDITWTTSVSPASIVARRTYEEAPNEVEFRIELEQNEQMVDQTFVRMSDKEDVTSGFEFNYDLSKDFAKNKANVYTLVSTMMDNEVSVTEVAGNTLPMSDQTTVVPLGIDIKTAGDYTISIPEGTNGIGVTLIDNVANTRTNLSALDYTVNLTAGTYEDRFFLEISPIHNTPTDIEAVTGDGLPANGARKVLIDGILYIVKGDKLYDVRGTMIK